MGKPRVKPNYRRRVLRLPDLIIAKRQFSIASARQLRAESTRRHRPVHRLVLLRASTGLQPHRRGALSPVPGIAASGRQHHQPAACRRASLAHEAADAGLLSPEWPRGLAASRESSSSDSGQGIG